MSKPRMGFRVGAVLLAMWMVGLLGHSASAGPKRKKGDRKQIDVLFSPNGGCRDRIVSEIKKARKRIRLQANFFTSEPIAEALIKAKKRGVEVVAVLDKSQEKQRYGRWRHLKRAGIPIYFDAEHATANNKIILIDQRTIITGSYNYTRSAEEKNAENVLIIRGDSRLFEKYLANFENHLEHSRRYSG